MKIVTYNVNGIKARLPRLLEYLAEQKPDVVCLQEIKSADDGFPADDIREAGYGALWHGQKGFNGVAILARDAEPVERHRGLGGDPEDDHSRYLEAEVNGVVVASIYLPNGNPVPGPKFDYKLRWIGRLTERARDLLAEERPVVLAGDYNVIPNDDDVFSVRAMQDDALMQPQSRAGFRALLAQGWTDALRTQAPGGGVWTFWDYQAGAWRRDAGFRIDHLLLSPIAADRFAGAGVDKEYRGREKASDHAPTWVRLRP
ncbi:exodeoxyribonuclease III [Sphingomonas sp.]|uniref:exodeoxyribonuclease III n=1 Tax=Sphingomonas sp. TaxID=28214 RepID=UPI001EB220E0|nr:exodeoxyribonuclease III [Sphingomonas sp.]MBX3594326.1 exodeoxyribonuclease III [Sphingomonas sp.]